MRAVLAALFSIACLAAHAEGLPLRMEVQGSGERTVIFEAGLGDNYSVWQQVQSKVANHCARTVSYTRAGYPGSPRSRAPRDAETIVEELRAALHNRGIEPPYVLVGHSLGGLYMQYFARNYPDEVTGLLLVDSTHWDHLERLQAEAAATYRTVRALSVLLLPIMRRELADAALAGEQVVASPPPRNMPTIVLSSTRAALITSGSAWALLGRMQDEIAAAFPGSQHIRVENSGHYIQRDRPEVVIEAARALAGCAERW